MRSPRFQPGAFVYILQGRTITRGSIKSVMWLGERWQYTFESHGESAHAMACEGDIFDEFGDAYKQLAASLKPAE